MQHVAGPFDKNYREFEQSWHVAKFDSVRKDILEQEPDILSDKPENEQVRGVRMPRGALAVFSMCPFP
jgi:hypothetical protein